MLKWLNKALGGNDGTEDKAAAEWLKRLKPVVERIDRNHIVKSGLTKRIQSYVAEGNDVGVLAEVAQTPKVGESLYITVHTYGRTKDNNVEAFYEGFDSAPPAMLLRWSRLLEAASSGHTGRCCIHMPDGSHWTEILLLHCAGLGISGWQRFKAGLRLELAVIEAMLVEADLPPHAYLAASFATPVDADYGVKYRAPLVAQARDYSEALLRHADAIRPLLTPSSVAQRLLVLEMLGKANAEALSAFVGALCVLGTANSKQVRADALPLIKRCAAAVTVPALKEIVATGKPENRTHAFRLLHSIAERENDEALQDAIRTMVKADKAASVQALIEEWEGREETLAKVEEVQYEYEVPDIVWSGVMTPELDAMLVDFWRTINASVERTNQQQRTYAQSEPAKRIGFKPNYESSYPDEWLNQLRQYIASADPHWDSGDRNARRRHSNWRHVQPALPALATNEAVSPQALVKLLKFFGLLYDRGHGFDAPAVTALNAMHRSHGRPSLLELSRMVHDMGDDTSRIFHAYCNGWAPLGEEWENAAVWPYFAEHQPLIVSELQQKAATSYDSNLDGVLRAIASFPMPPPSVVHTLFELALGPGKTYRRRAQDALAQWPDKEERIIAALADGKGDTRMVAAQWLGRLRHAPAIPALEQAVAKEKQDLAKGAMLDALQSLGQPVEKYLDRAKLLAEAEKLLKKGLPKDLDWFPWDALPPLHWADNGEPVPGPVLRWMLAQAVKLKSSEPNAVLRQYCAMFDPREREVFGQFLLETWLNEDIRPISPELAQSMAQSQARSTHASIQRWPKAYEGSPLVGKSVEEITAYLLPRLMRQPAGSASGSRGVLALVAACAGGDVAAPVARYLKEFYGARAAQGRALIVMLAWIDHPSATQLMLSIGNRFRTKSFQEEATRQAEALAERKGWTLAELADRTIPSAGFDENDKLELSYGDRVFTARLLPDFGIELLNPDGKVIKSLPEPRQDEDADQVKDSKKAFSTAKKSIKDIVKLQTERLYEALCTEREWPFEDWQQYLNRHPVMRRLLQRLVWAQFEDGKVVQLFRPLDDGSLSDADDNAVTLPASAHVRLAHDSLLSGEQITQWQQHLLDYEIAPLFQQLGKGVYRLPADKAKLSEITDFEGHLIQTFALRNRAGKLGYTRGATEDGGWFYTYEKRFPTLGLTAVIQFTGNGVPEENRTVALETLSFEKSGDTQIGRNAALALTRVPKVLLSECYNDMRLIAADGSGYAEDWRKQSEY